MGYKFFGSVDARVLSRGMSQWRGANERTNGNPVQCSGTCYTWALGRSGVETKGRWECCYNPGKLEPRWRAIDSAGNVLIERPGQNH